MPLTYARELPSCIADARPPQIGVGTGGAVLTRAPFRMAGEALDGTTVSGGTVRHDFGYALFDLEKKSLDVFDRLGNRIASCRYGPGEVSCELSATTTR